jgi:hypothetical protein
MLLEKITGFLGLGNIAGTDSRTALLIGASMMISVIHQPNQPLLWAVFLPQIGSIILILIPMLYLNRRNIDLGDKWVWIPLAVIVGIGVARVPYAWITGDTLWGMTKEITHAVYLVCMFLLYLTCRKLGSAVFKIMPFFAVVASLGMVVFGFINPGIRGGGLISYANYDIATIFLIMTVLLSPAEKRWWLSAFAVVGLFFTGAEVALFAMGVLFITILIRRDWGKRALLPVAALCVTLLVCTPLGITQKLYASAYNRVAALAGVPFADDTIANVPTVDVFNFPAANLTEKDALLDKATNLRWTMFWKISPIKPLGYGYNINYFYYPLDESRGATAQGGGEGVGIGDRLLKAGVLGGIPHNQILIIIEQLGLVALLAWLVVTGRLLLKSGWTYVWIAYLALGFWDHENWTVCAPWLFVMAGVCSANPMKVKDYIFRKV